MHMKIFYIIVIIQLIFSPLLSSSNTLTLIYTNNTNGVFQNCNCPARSYGALEKRAWLIDSLRQAYDDVLLVDTGDILDIRKDSLLHRYIMKAYNKIGYDYWVCGDQDFTEGVDYFKKYLLNSNMSLLNTNLYIDDELPGEMYQIRSFKFITIGIVGTISQRINQYIADDMYDVRITNQMETLAPIIEKLDKETDFIIVLSHSGFENDRIIAQKFPQIDLIIGGHSQTIVENPHQEGKCLIVQAGESGYRTGILNLHFEKHYLNSYENQLYLLEKNHPDDPDVLEMIYEYQRMRLSKIEKLIINE